MKVWVTSDEMYPVQCETSFTDPEISEEIELTEEEYAAWKKAEKDFFEWNDKIGALQDVVIRARNEKNINERFKYLRIQK